MIASRNVSLVAAGFGAVAMTAAGYVGLKDDDKSDFVVSPPVLLRPATSPAPTALAQAYSAMDRGAVIYDLQKHLKRVGCYRGTINGVWTAETRTAMGAFNDKVNARLSTAEPDEALLTLVAGHTGFACEASVNVRVARVTPAVQASPVRPPEAKPVAVVTAASEAPSYFVSPPLPIRDMGSLESVSGGSGNTGSETQVSSVDQFRESDTTPGTREAAEPARQSEMTRPESIEQLQPDQSFAPVPPVRSDKKYKRKAVAKKYAKPPKFMKSFMRSVEGALSSIGIN